MYKYICIHPKKKVYIWLERKLYEEKINIGNFISKCTEMYWLHDTLLLFEI